MDFQDAVAFHGHACPGLALGFRVATLALKKLGPVRAADEELVAVVENNSCAVDAIQFFCGCTFGKGNLVFRDYGKQVYTFLRRPAGGGLRIAVRWQGPEESAETRSHWQRYLQGDRSPDVMGGVQQRKKEKMEAILAASDEELFAVSTSDEPLPKPARIYESRTCLGCGEKVMETRTHEQNGGLFCIPCAEAGNATKKG